MTAGVGADRPFIHDRSLVLIVLVVWSIRVGSRPMSDPVDDKGANCSPLAAGDKRPIPRSRPSCGRSIFLRLHLDETQSSSFISRILDLGDIRPMIRPIASTPSPCGSPTCQTSVRPSHSIHLSRS
uniref:Secreted protein n=1 Tax=Bionectria ochroleuca TaxID=29856 RepID=A0A8H7TSZ5_BIOOC